MTNGAGMGGTRLGVGLMVAQAIAFTIDTAAIRALSDSVTFWMIGELRAIGGMALVVVLAVCAGPGRSVFRTVNVPVMVLRVAATTAYGWVLIASFALLDFTSATVISFATVLWVAVLAGPILGETVGIRRWVACIVGFLGVLLIIKPGAQVSWVSLGILLATSTNAAAFLLNRELQLDGDRAETILLYVNLAMLVSFSPALFEPLPDWSWWLVGACITGPLGLAAGIVALKYAEASALAPYQYVRLPMAALAGVLVFSEVPDVFTIGGAVLIVAACVVNEGR